MQNKQTQTFLCTPTGVQTSVRSCDDHTSKQTTKLNSTVMDNKGFRIWTRIDLLAETLWCRPRMVRLSHTDGEENREERLLRAAWHGRTGSIVDFSKTQFEIKFSWHSFNTRTAAEKRTDTHKEVGACLRKWLYSMHMHANEQSTDSMFHQTQWVYTAF